MSNRVLKAKGNNKELYQITTELCGHRKLNPMLNSTSNNVLADEFLDFFINKTETIRSNLKGHQKYQPAKCSVKENLNTFNPLLQTEILGIIGLVKAKLCELDVVPKIY